MSEHGYVCSPLEAAHHAGDVLLFNPVRIQLMIKAGMENIGNHGIVNTIPYAQNAVPDIENQSEAGELQQLEDHPVVEGPLLFP